VALTMAAPVWDFNASYFLRHTGRTLKFKGTMLRTRITRSMLDFSSSGGVTKLPSATSYSQPSRGQGKLERNKSDINKTVRAICPNSLDHRRSRRAPSNTNSAGEIRTKIGRTDAKARASAECTSRPEVSVHDTRPDELQE